MKHVVMFSGGVGSWAAAKRVVEAHGVDSTTLLFTDTLIEDQDLYRFIDEAAANVGAPLVKIADGRTPWEVFRDVRFLGNTRVDPCSRILKRDLADRWISDRFKPDEVRVHVGIDWTESHRYERMAPRKLPYVYEAPLLAEPLLSKEEVFAWLASEGIELPRLYRLGFPHNNCGGGCIKAGHGHFAMLLEKLPEVFGEWESNEEELREELGDVAILRDRRGGVTKPLTLRALRERVQGGGEVDRFDVGGCGCFLDDGE
jgi:3'-phosphoadenosine 5'-phosphosulfate sulfotransferase (PAPS reductase)/FAD synthetase